MLIMSDISEFKFEALSSENGHLEHHFLRGNLMKHSRVWGAAFTVLPH